jgi:hypothetical protein
MFTTDAKEIAKKNVMATANLGGYEKDRKNGFWSFSH